MIVCTWFFMTTDLLKISYVTEFMKTFRALTSVIPITASGDRWCPGPGCQGTLCVPDWSSMAGQPQWGWKPLASSGTNRLPSSQKWGDPCGEKVWPEFTVQPRQRVLGRRVEMWGKGEPGDGGPELFRAQVACPTACHFLLQITCGGSTTAVAFQSRRAGFTKRTHGRQPNLWFSKVSRGHDIFTKTGNRISNFPGSKVFALCLFP